VSPNSKLLIPRIGDESVVANSWESFLQDRPLVAPGVRNVVLDSWRRSRSEAVDPASSSAPTADVEKIRQLRERSRDLYEAAKPVLETLREILRESGTLIMLSDPSGTILDLNGESRARGGEERHRELERRRPAVRQGIRVPYQDVRHEGRGERIFGRSAGSSAPVAVPAEESRG